MTVLLVGADQLGNIPRELEQIGCKHIIHWNGRKANTRKKCIPTNIDLVLVFYDYVNHGLMDIVKEQAKRRQLPVLFSRRGTCDLKKTLFQYFQDRNRQQLLSDSRAKNSV